MEDSNGETANVVDVGDRMAWALEGIANAITPRNVAAGHDAYDGHITSLTEALMGITEGLSAIAAAIEIHAEAVHESKGEA